MAFYVDPTATGVFEPTLQQGDIIFPIPFLAYRIATAATLAEQADDIARLAVTDLTGLEGVAEAGKMVVGYERKPAIIVSQSCDIERGINPTLIAPIRSFESVFPRMTVGSGSFKQDK